MIESLDICILLFEFSAVCVCMSVYLDLPFW